MNLKITLLAVSTISLFLAACGGGSNNPYDGAWTLAYPAPSNTATDFGVSGATCLNPLVSIIITNSAGSATVTGSCTSAASGVVATPVFNIGVAITAKQDIASQDVFTAIANGATYTGKCLNTSVCAATNGTSTISMTR